VCASPTVSQPVSQYSQRMQASCNQATPTGSPGLKSVTPGPSAATTPATSWPGMNGSEGFTGQSPSAACKSVWHTPQAITLTRISPGPGTGTGTSSITSGLPNWRTIAAFIILAILLNSIVDAVGLGTWHVRVLTQIKLSVGLRCNAATTM